MVSEKLRIDPHSPAYEAARAEMVEVLRQIGREDSRNGYTRMADDLAVGNLMEVPTWIALALMARAPAELTGWQPIETAPKDGTRVLLWTDTRITASDIHYVEQVCEQEHFALAQIGEWDHEWTCPLIGEPTHWQPLPAPPGTTRAPADLRSALEAETIERCAKVALSPGFIEARDTEWDEGVNFAKRYIATAIRALAPTKEPAA